jgi:putative oxidoreductase
MGLLRRVAAIWLKISDSLQFLPPLLTRLVIGVGFYYTGKGKLGDLDKVTGFFNDLGIPMPHANAVFVSGLEFIGGICLVLGLGTRVFAALLSCSMIVALLTADKEAFVMKFPSDITDVTSFTFLLFLVWLVFYGAGPISIDHFLGKWLGVAKKTEESS